MKFSIAVFAVFCTSYAFGACPAGWVAFEQSCYKFQDDHETWIGARVMCRMHGSDLIAIETPAEQTWFQNIARTYNHTDEDEGFWLGATNWEEESKWVWESANNAPLTYSVWGKGQPNNRLNRENCLAAVLYFDYIWSDEYCDGLHIQYVCEKKASAAPLVG